MKAPETSDLSEAASCSLETSIPLLTIVPPGVKAMEMSAIGGLSVAINPDSRCI